MILNGYNAAGQRQSSGTIVGGVPVEQWEREQEIQSRRAAVVAAVLAAGIGALLVIAGT